MTMKVNSNILLQLKFCFHLNGLSVLCVIIGASENR